MEQLTTFTRKLHESQNWNYYFSIRCIRIIMVVQVWYSIAICLFQNQFYSVCNQLEKLSFIQYLKKLAWGGVFRLICQLMYYDFSGNIKSNAQVSAKNTHSQVSQRPAILSGITALREEQWQLQYSHLRRNSVCGSDSISKPTSMLTDMACLPIPIYLFGNKADYGHTESKYFSP